MGAGASVEEGDKRAIEVLFHRLDVNGNGSLDLQEIREMCKGMGEELGEKCSKTFFDAWDSNHDKKVQGQEWTAMWEKEVNESGVEPTRMNFHFFQQLADQAEKRRGESCGKHLLILGVGPGISSAVARKFGSEGFCVSLASQKMAEAKAAEEALAKFNPKIKSFTYEFEASDAKSVKRACAAASAAAGPVSVLHYNPYNLEGGNLLKDDAEGVAKSVAVGVTGLVAATQSLYEDLKTTKGAILVTCSGAGMPGVPDEVEAMLTGLNVAGYMVSKAAQHKLTATLYHKLKPDGIFVGKVNVNATVKGTAWDDGTAKIEPDSVANAFWKLNSDRSDVIANVDNPPVQSK